MMDKQPKVSIVILNWNTWEETIECLESLEDINYENYNIILVDNGSEDDSVERIKSYLSGDIKVSPKFGRFKPDSKPIEYQTIELTEGEFDMNLSNIYDGGSFTFVESDENLGFPGGCNVGIQVARAASADYLLLLNNDVVVKDDFLTALVSESESRDDVGVVGSRIMHYDDPQKMQAAGGDIYWLLGYFHIHGQNATNTDDYGEVAERDYVWGTSALTSMDAINDVGLMDTNFFYGVEEYDYHTRIKNEGYGIYYVPDSVVWHKGGMSAEKLTEYSDSLSFIKNSQGPYKSKYFYHFYRKHLPWGIFFLPFTIRTAIYFLQNALNRGNPLTPDG